MSDDYADHLYTANGSNDARSPASPIKAGGEDSVAVWVPVDKHSGMDFDADSATAKSDAKRSLPAQDSEVILIRAGAAEAKRGR